MTRLFIVAAMLSGSLFGQTTFEVASVKRNTSMVSRESIDVLRLTDATSKVVCPKSAPDSIAATMKSRVMPGKTMIEHQKIRKYLYWQATVAHALACRFSRPGIDYLCVPQPTRRNPVRNPRPPHPEAPGPPRSPPRIRNCRFHPDLHGRRAPGGGRVALPRPAAYAVEGLAERGMGQDRREPPRPLLHLDRRRPQATAAGNGALQPRVAGHRADCRACMRGREFRS